MKKHLLALVALVLMLIPATSVAAPPTAASPAGSNKQADPPVVAPESDIYQEVVEFTPGMTDEEVNVRLKKIPKNNRHLVTDAMKRPDFQGIVTKTVYVKRTPEGDRPMRKDEVILLTGMSPSMGARFVADTQTYNGLTISITKTGYETSWNLFGDFSWDLSQVFTFFTNGAALSWAGQLTMINDASSIWGDTPGYCYPEQATLVRVTEDAGAAWKFPMQTPCYETMTYTTGGMFSTSITETTFQNELSNISFTYWHYYLSLGFSFSAVGTPGASYFTVTPTTGQWNIAVYSSILH
ncbi:MAG TPA: hypothetical protein VD969_01640 [Symbiobacteriaceae bacterium]|nr:hypothetical protein [Symbiobacteriaceae bacterium]